MVRFLLQLLKAFDLHSNFNKSCPSVLATDDAVLAAGRNTELAYQVAKAAKELKRDMENALLANVAQRKQ